MWRSKSSSNEERRRGARGGRNPTTPTGRVGIINNSKTLADNKNTHKPMNNVHNDHVCVNSREGWESVC